MILLTIFLLYLFCIAPNLTLNKKGLMRHRRMQQFENYYIAHRGLYVKQKEQEKEQEQKPEQTSEPPSCTTESSQSSFTANTQLIPENSMQAFKRAVDGGFGIELDVQLTKDRRLVVFHDKTLKRMCGADRKIHECTYEELQSYGLAGTQERIPLFKDVLKMVGGRVPLIVEIKEHGNWKLTTQAAAKHLDWYEKRYGKRKNANMADGTAKTEYDQALFCVESFHPGVVAWFRAHRRHYLRGQLSSDYMREKVNNRWSSRFIVSNLLLNWAGRPDFIAYNCLYADQFSYRLIRHLFRTEHVAWTVKSQEQLDSLRRIYQIYIFEGFIPEDETGIN